MIKTIRKSKRVYLIIILFLFLLSSGCGDKKSAEPLLKGGIFDFYSDTIVKESGPIEVDHSIREFSVIYVGDIMVHAGQLKKAYDAKSDSFNFVKSFEYVKPYLTSVDYSIGNLETTLNGRNLNKNYIKKTTVMGYDGYPCFNSPDSLAEALKDSGFDFLLTSNNHSLDTRKSGLVRTIEVLDKAGLDHTGTFLNKEDKHSPKIINIGGHKIGIINYTYATNGISIADMWMVNTLDLYKEKYINKLYQDLENMKQIKDLDLIWVFMHYGNEYFKYPEKNYQVPITEKLLEKGADLVIGSHPHTLEPLIIDGEGKFRGIYSLGNFISSQKNINKYKADTDIGLLLKLVYRSVGGRKPKVVKIGLLPTFTLWQENRIMVLPINEESIKRLNGDPTIKLDNWARQRIEYAQNNTVDHLLYYYNKQKEKKSDTIGSPNIENGYYIINLE